MYRKNKINDNTSMKSVDEVNDKVNDKVNELLKLLTIHPDYTVTELAAIFNVSRKTIAARLKELKDRGLIERIGSSKKGF